MYVVEFQKRGLPHAHIALRVKGPQPLTPEELDRYIWAEVPVITADSTECDRELQRLVLLHMQHKKHVPERCYKRSKRRNAPVTPGPSVCKYGFPFELQEVTTITEDGRVLHRRRKECDRIVPSYSPAMLLRYKTHINVQYAEGIKLIKYMRKYMCKVRTHARTHAHTHAHARASTHTHARTHTHAHTHTHKWCCPHLAVVWARARTGQRLPSSVRVMNPRQWMSTRISSWAGTSVPRRRAGG